MSKYDRKERRERLEAIRERLAKEVESCPCCGGPCYMQGAGEVAVVGHEDLEFLLEALREAHDDAD